MIASTIVGVSLGYPLITFTACLFAYICWILFRISQLSEWIERARRLDPPPNHFEGIWGEIADDVRLLTRRYQKDKVRLQTVVTRVQEMTSALSDGVVLVDQRGNINWWNHAAQDLFRFQSIDMGHRLTNIIRHPRFISYFESQKYDKPLLFDSLRKKDQYLEFKVHPFGQGERLVIIRDITQVQRLEQVRKDFIGNLSHELRTPLTVIQGYLETFTDSHDLKPVWQKPLEQMLQQGKRMTALIDDLTTLSRLETDTADLKQTRVELDPLLESIVLDAQALSNNQHQFDLCGVKNIRLHGNQSELRSAFSNLIFNAGKYSPKAGKITIEVKQTNLCCEVKIHDKGLGIDSKHIPRLTERFYRVDDGRATSMGGTGLGLAIVKHVLIRHDGELKISSRLGRGSTFNCQFPTHRIV
ncbi:MAG: two-component system phosphate regulon sensor histidine kinase PhoR [Lentisphaeria bacterium]|jgi:two-component system phosphate regulon sensor histidine kinase PhoR